VISKNLLLGWAIVLLGLYVLTSIPIRVGASPKSLYVIADIRSDPTPIRAYDVQFDGTLVYQASYDVPHHGIGAVGLAIDSDNAFLFVTYESSNVIELISATTMTSAGYTIAPNATNLAGIVLDSDSGKVYTVDRNSDTLYVYSWNPVVKTLTLDSLETLSGVSLAHGLALDEVNDLLYVGDMVTTNNIRVFSTEDWSLVSSYTVSQKVQGIAVDVANNVVYTGNAYPYSGSKGLLIQYDMMAKAETSVNIRTLPGATTDDNVVGLAVDPDSANLYITTGNQGAGGSDRVLAFDIGLNLIHATGDIGNPTGIAIPIEEVSYNPLGLAKSALPDPVLPGETITYTISFDNLLNNFTVDNVTLIDTLPVQTVFVSASDDGVYDAGSHSVTWVVGTLSSGAAPQSVTLVAAVKEDTVAGTILDNSVSVDSDETPPTTQHAYTTVATAPTIESCDAVGTRKDSYDTDDTVYVNGSGYMPSTSYYVYVVNDTTWVDRMAIPGSPVSVASDGLGTIHPTIVWSPPLTPGRYDIVVDVNCNGLYEVGIDTLDNNDINVTAGFFVIPEVWLGTILILAGCLAAFGAFRASKRKRKNS
jgi:uncharacterized repeat protein (TIGR01451 family)